MDWLPWAVLTTIVWGVSAVASKPATDRLGPQRMFFYAALAEAAVMAAMALVLPRPAWTWDTAIALVGMLAGFSGILGYLFYYEGLALGTVGVVGTIGAAYPVLTTVLGVLLLGEGMTGPHGIGVVLLTLCVLLLAHGGRGAKVPRRAVAFALLGFVAWGFWGLFAKVGVDAMGEANVFACYALADVAVVAAYRAVRTPNPMPPDPGARRLAFFAVLGAAVGAVALTVAFGHGPASLVAPVSGSYPIIATLLAAPALKERLTSRVLLGLLCFAGGIVLVAWA